MGQRGSHKSQCKILNGKKKTITCTVEYDAIGEADLAEERERNARAEAEKNKARDAIVASQGKKKKK